MKILRVSAVVLLAIVAAGCASRGGSPSKTNENGNASNQSATSQTTANSGAGSASPAAPAPAATTAPPPLIGTFVLAEIRDAGVINLEPGRTTIISFTADGGYSRVAKKGTLTYHSDAGNFRLEGDKFVLLISMSQSKMFNPPRRVVHTYSLSADGKELLLTSVKGSTSVWRRTDGLAAKQ